MSHDAIHQLALDLTPPRQPSFENFLTGRNQDALILLRQLLTSQLHESIVYLFGSNFSGKSHLLFASVQLARDLGFPATYFVGAEGLDDLPEPEIMPWLALDHADTWDSRWQAMVFRAINLRRERGGTLIIAGREPPAHLQLREDLRTRLGWGLVIPLHPLEDHEKPTAVANYAAQRGIQLSEEVIDYLLTRGSRDLPTLLATIVALDQFSLEKKRPITVPLLRSWWAEQLSLSL